MSTKLEEWIEANREKFIQISDNIWRYAELGLFEEKSPEWSLNLEINERA